LRWTEEAEAALAKVVERERLSREECAALQQQLAVAQQMLHDASERQQQGQLHIKQLLEDLDQKQKYASF
jgi:hypothetical protein